MSPSAVLHHAPTALITIDTYGRIESMNAAAERAFGISGRVVKREIAHNLIHHTRTDGSLHSIETCPIVNVLETGEPIHVAHDVFWTPAGRQIPVSYDASPVYVNEPPEIAGVSIAFHRLDVGERRELDTYLAANVVPMSRALADGTMLAANDRCLDVHGASRAELDAGRLNWVALTTDESLARNQRALAEVQSYGIARPFDKVYRDGTAVRIVLARYAAPDDMFAVILPLDNKPRAYALADRAYDVLKRARGLLSALMTYWLDVPLDLVALL